MSKLMQHFFIEKIVFPNPSRTVSTPPYISLANGVADPEII